MTSPFFAKILSPYREWAMKIEDSEVYTTPLNGFFQWKTQFFILHSMHAFTAQKCTNGPNHLNQWVKFWMKHGLFQCNCTNIGSTHLVLEIRFSKYYASKYVRNQAKKITYLEAIIFREFYALFSKPDELTQYYFSIFSTVALK